MTDEELEVIQKRANAATPGPWYNYGSGNTDGAAVGTFPLTALPDSFRIWYKVPGFIEVLGCSEWLRIEDADLDFIVHARQDIPVLLAEVKRLKTENDKLRKSE